MEKEKSHSGIIPLQRGYTYMLNSIRAQPKCIPYLVSNISACIMAPQVKTFELRSISTEYFEYLLSKNNYDTPFVGDIKSCALLNLNSLYAISASNKVWMKIKRFQKSNSTDSSSVSCIESETYSIQCCAVSLVEKDEFVLYVTNEKYFNISQALKINMDGNPSVKVTLEKFNINGDYPPIAKDIAVTLVDLGYDLNMSILQNVILKYFKLPKHLKKGELFTINVRRICPELTSTLTDAQIDEIHLKVTEVVGKSNEPINNDLGFYVEETTNVYNSSKVQSFIPAVYTKFVSLRNKKGYEICNCPGGFEKSYKRLSSFFNLVLNCDKLDFVPMVLLSGSKGSGKKTVVEATSARFGLKLFVVECFDFVGDATLMESKLTNMTTQLKKLAPSVVLMENIELLGRDEQCFECLTAVDVFQKHVEKLFKDSRKSMIIVGSTNKTRKVVPSIERMFVQRINLESLKKDEAADALTWLVCDAGMFIEPEVVTRVVERTNGYLFADFAKLVRIASKFQREDKDIGHEEMLLLKECHLDRAFHVVEALYSDAIGCARVPSVHWDDVGGLKDIKEEIMLALNLPLKHPELVGSGLRISGFLFFGPPGTGKTLMAKAIATEFNYSFLSVKGPELMNMYVGQSEKNVREVFQRARDAAPCIIFFDELDSLAPNRGRDSNGVTDKIVSQLLTEMDGLQSNVGLFVIGATNRPDLVDPALLRPGRFDKMFYIGVCETSFSKLSVIRALTKRFALGDDVRLEQIVESLPQHVTGADMYSICSNAWLEAAHRCINKMNKGGEVVLPLSVTMDDFQQAINVFVPSLTPDIIGAYDQFRNSHG